MKFRHLHDIGVLFRVTAAAAGIAVIFAGCGKEKDEKAAKEAPAPAASVQAPAQAPAMPQANAMPEGHPAVDKNDISMHRATHAGMKKQKEVRLTEAVRARWKEAKLKVTDASTKRTVTMTLTVGTATAVGTEGYKLKLDALVPDYAIAGDHIESRSNEPKNPAVLVTLFKGDAVVARGWIFRDLADFNSYNNDRFQLVLESPAAGNKK